jgi:hypothetical protein
MIIRMGDAPDNALVPFAFLKDLWAALSGIIQ